MSDTPQGEGWWLASDGKYYPPQSPPPPPSAAPPPQTPAEPKRKRRWVRTLLIVVGIPLLLLGGCVALLAGVGEELERQTGPADPADFDLDINVCEFTGLGYPEAAGTITNTSDEKQGFEIKFVISADDVRLVERSHYVDAIDPGQVAAFDVGFIEAADATSDTTPVCEASVDYSLFDD